MKFLQELKIFRTAKHLSKKLILKIIFFRISELTKKLNIRNKKNNKPSSEIMYEVKTKFKQIKPKT